MDSGHANSEARTAHSSIKYSVEFVIDCERCNDIVLVDEVGSQPPLKPQIKLFYFLLVTYLYRALQSPRINMSLLILSSTYTSTLGESLLPENHPLKNSPRELIQDNTLIYDSQASNPSQIFLAINNRACKFSIRRHLQTSRISKLGQL